MAEFAPSASTKRGIQVLLIGLAAVLALVMVAGVLFLISRTDTPAFIRVFSDGLGRKGLATGPLIIALWFLIGGFLAGKEGKIPFLVWFVIMALYINWAVMVALGVLTLVGGGAWWLIQADKKLSAVTLGFLAVLVGTQFLPTPAVNALDPGTWWLAAGKVILSCLVLTALVGFGVLAVVHEWIKIDTSGFALGAILRGIQKLRRSDGY